MLYRNVHLRNMHGIGRYNTIISILYMLNIKFRLHGNRTCISKHWLASTAQLAARDHADKHKKYTIMTFILKIETLVF